MALAGGSTPLRLYSLLARLDLPWRSVHLFWGDERMVPFENPSSNFGAARRAMLSSIDIPKGNVHPVPVDASPAEAAGLYESDLRDFFGVGKSSGGATFDLVILGMGEDGHTASLFPGSDALEERERWAVAVEAPEGAGPARRVTLTLPILNSAESALFLVSGREKADALHDVLQMGRHAASQYPAAMIRPEGTLLWFADSAAAGGMPPTGPR